MTKYEEYLARGKARHGEKFDTSQLAQRFVNAFNSQARIEVEFCDDAGKAYTVKRGRVGVTTGWKPSFMLMLTARAIGSSWLLSERDRIVPMRAGVKKRDAEASGCLTGAQRR